MTRLPASPPRQQAVRRKKPSARAGWLGFEVQRAEASIIDMETTRGVAAEGTWSHAIECSSASTRDTEVQAHTSPEQSHCRFIGDLPERRRAPCCSRHFARVRVLACAYLEARVHLMRKALTSPIRVVGYLVL